MNLELTGAQVKCPNCGAIYFQTTDQYDPRAILTGEMLEWIPRYGPDGLNWGLPFAASDLSEAVICEGCGAPLAPTGRLGLERLVLGEGAAEGRGQRAESGEQENKEEGRSSELGVRSGEETENQGPIGQEPIVEEKAPEVPSYLVQEHCGECGKFLPIGELEGHIKNTHPKLTKDKIENKGLEGSASLDTTKKPDEVKQVKKGKGQSKAQVPEQQLPLEKTFPFPCAMCEAGFDDEAGLKDHMAGHEMGTVQRAVKN